MDGRNSSGRKISLLNDSCDSDVAAAYPTKIQLPPLASVHAQHPHHPHHHHHHHQHHHQHHSSSRAASSCASTPSPSPQTPQLIRSSSSESRGYQTPSPLTPSFNSFDHAAAAGPKRPSQQRPHQQAFFVYAHPHAKMHDPTLSLYPPLPDAAGAMPSAYPMPAQMPQPMPLQPVHPTQAGAAYPRSSTSPSSEPSRVSNVSAASNPKQQPKKNQYPCPLAKQVGCNDFFTTSGHAARHAKKHTGKKDAFCPECNKAFTRKDNMEQHRRTHQNGRGASRTANGDAAKVKKPAAAKPVKKPTAKAEQQFEAAVEQQLVEDQQPFVSAAPQGMPIPPVSSLPQQLLDQTLMIPPAGPYFMGSGLDTGPVPALPMAMPDLSTRPPLHRSNFTNSLEFIPPSAAMVADPDALHYAYPSPGLSNGLNSLALAASEHRRLSEEKSAGASPQETPSQETSSIGTP